MVKDNSAIKYFQKIYIINLPERLDRRKEIEKQLNNINLSLSSPNVKLFSAIRPQDAGEFETIGTKGCFLSHLAVLKDALEHKYQTILILEDDVNFIKNFNTKIIETITTLAKVKWDIFYGSHGIHFSNETLSSTVQEVPVGDDFITSHFIAFHGNVIGEMAQELELMLTRKDGDPNGGPMDIRGAYSTIRENYPQYKTFASFPVLGFQRSSKTDAHTLHWFDKVFLIRNVVAILRKFKNNPFKPSVILVFCIAWFMG